MGVDILSGKYCFCLQTKNSPLTEFAIWQNIYSSIQNWCRYSWFIDNTRSAWVSYSTRTCRRCGPLTSTGYTKRRVTRDLKFWNIFNQNSNFPLCSISQKTNIGAWSQFWIWYFSMITIFYSLPSSRLQIFYLCPILCQTLVWVPATLGSSDRSLLIYCDSLDRTRYPVTSDMPHDMWYVTCHVSRSLITPGSLWTGWMSVWDSGTHSATITRYKPFRLTVDKCFNLDLEIKISVLGPEVRLWPGWRGAHVLWHRPCGVPGALQDHVASADQEILSQHPDHPGGL